MDKFGRNRPKGLDLLGPARLSTPQVGLYHGFCSPDRTTPVSQSALVCRVVASRREEHFARCPPSKWRVSLNGSPSSAFGRILPREREDCRLERRRSPSPTRSPAKLAHCRDSPTVTFPSHKAGNRCRSGNLGQVLPHCAGNTLRGRVLTGLYARVMALTPWACRALWTSGGSKISGDAS